MLKSALEVQRELASPAPTTVRTEGEAGKMETEREASSSTMGFFQDLPVLKPGFSDVELSTTSSATPPDDPALPRLLSLYLPTHKSIITNHLHHLSRLAISRTVLALGVEAETHAPTLHALTTFGRENKTDALWTSPAWRALKEIGVREGIVAVAYAKSAETERVNRRVYGFSLGHVWGPAGCMTGCPGSMTDGAAAMLARRLGDVDGEETGRLRVLEEVYRRLVSRDVKYAWSSGQWMTERSGGSDVSGTETRARRLRSEEVAADEGEGRGEDAVGMPLGMWRIDGFKWFSSATDSEMAVLLARTEKGLSAFYMPMRRRKGNRVAAVDVVNLEAPPETELNGVRIQRLKNKLGTKSLPTAELEIKGARAWLIGTEGRGVAEISAVLNITRLTTAAGSVANWARGLAICRAYSKVRKVRGGLLQDNPTHLRWMADETVKYHTAAHFTFFGVALQGALEQSHEAVVANTKAKDLIPSDKTKIAVLLRLLLPVMKAQVSVASVDGLRQCMECLGGVGYCENNEDGGLLNIAKIYRDNLVNPIWEGTVSVMAEDVVRVLTDQRLGDGDVLGNVFAPWALKVLSVCADVFQQEIETLKKRLAVLSELVKDKGKDELLYNGRQILDHLEAVVSGTVLVYDASVNPAFVAQEIAMRWVRSKGPRESVVEASTPWKDAVRIDKAIFLGTTHVEAQRLEKL